MKLAKFTKAPADRKRYVLDYTDWLDDDETVVTAVFTVVTPTDAPSPGDPLVIDGNSVVSAGKEVAFFVGHGDDGVLYDAQVLITTSGGQNKEDTVQFYVHED